MSSTKELPWDRLATSDQTGKRIYLYPSEVRGKWKRLRSLLSAALIAVFLGLPWVRVGGHQAVLMDIPNRRFAIFGLTFWAHDAPLLFFIAGGAVFSIAFVTAIWGRVWCGWACPQTVFVEQVFRRVETWIEGDSVARKRLDAGPLNFQKLFKKTAKWGAFAVLAAILSHSFLAYFVGTEALGQMMAKSPAENPSSFLVMLGMTGAVLFDFGWFREQFCTVVCPYGRFQSVLMDAHSTVVAYDVARGEPRRGSSPVHEAPAKPGDCVNCYRCVQVCPTGIDIRRGVQLECVACTACMDACDDVMSRLKKPLGLIRYGNQALTVGTQSASPTWYKRPRAWAYLLILLAFVVGLQVTVSHRSPIEVALIRGVEAPYQEIPGEAGATLVLNHFKVDLRNQTFDTQKIEFSLDADTLRQGASLVVSNHLGVTEPGEPERFDLFLKFPKSFLNFGHGSMKVQVQAVSQKDSSVIQFVQEARLVGPLR